MFLIKENAPKVSRSYVIIFPSFLSVTTSQNFPPYCNAILVAMWFRWHWPIGQRQRHIWTFLCDDQLNGQSIGHRIEKVEFKTHVPCSARQGEKGNFFTWVFIHCLAPNLSAKRYRCCGWFFYWYLLIHFPTMTPQDIWMIPKSVLAKNFCKKWMINFGWK